MADSMSQGTWSVDLCHNWRRIATVTGSAYEFRAVHRWLEQGEWELTCPASAVEWGSIYDERRDELVDPTPEDVNTVRLVNDGSIAFAGYVAALSEGSGGLEVVTTGDGQRYTWSGPDLWHLLAGYIAFPDPSTYQPWAVSHDVRTGRASSVIAAYLDHNLGSSALPERQAPGFTVVDQGAGPSDEWSARLAPLSHVVARICEQAEIGCWLSIDFDGNVTATIGAPRNLSERIVVSDQGDLSTVRVRHVPATATWVLAGGQGEGASRVFREAATPEATGQARREMFVDYSSLSSASELQRAANVQLRLGAESWSIYGEVTDELAATLRYGRDFRVGDLIGVEVDGRRHTVPVTSVTFEISASRQVVRPSLGTAAPNELVGLTRDVAGLADRFRTDIA